MTTPPTPRLRLPRRPPLRRLARGLAAALGVVAVLGVAVLATGCAGASAVTIDGVAVPRIQHRFTGAYYEIEHQRAHPRPQGPSSGVTGEGGSLGGTLCGMQIDFGVDHQGDHLLLNGFLDGTVVAYLEVRQLDEVRRITGSFGKLGVDLEVGPGRIAGHVGLRAIVATSDGDSFVGFVKQTGWTGPYPVVLDGRDALWAMPAAGQALVAAGVLTCYLAASDKYGAARGLHLRFGGPAESVPPFTSTVHGR